MEKQAPRKYCHLFKFCLIFVSKLLQKLQFIFFIISVLTGKLIKLKR
jgi:hypothetical protein